MQCAPDSINRNPGNLYDNQQWPQGIDGHQLGDILVLVKVPRLASHNGRKLVSGQPDDVRTQKVSREDDPELRLGTVCVKLPAKRAA